MEFLVNLLLPFLLYVVAIILLVILIFVGLRLINLLDKMDSIVDRVDGIVDNIDDKVNSFNRLFRVMGSACDSVASISDSFLGAATGAISKVFGRFKKEKKESYEEDEDYE